MELPWTVLSSLSPKLSVIRCNWEETFKLLIVEAWWKHSIAS